MAIFVIGDLHLSLGADKPMDVFPGWEGYLPKLERNWRALIQYDSGVRQWSQPIANEALQVMLKDMTQVIHGDTQHFWNGGINQREEVTNGTTNSHGVTIRNADMLKANALILNGMREDGLTSY